MRATPVCLLCLWGFAAAPGFAADGIHRCVGEDGVSIYTDQPCDSFGAIDRKPDAAAAGRSESVEATADATDSGFTRADCVRRTDTLLFELRRAIESQNVNQLAGLYHWPGIGTRASRGILDRLERIVARPLAAAELVFPEPPPPSDEVAWYGDMASEIASDAPIEPVEREEIVRSEEPVAVHIEQSLPGEISPRFVENLRLVRHAECWWLRF
jgi:hypothetical protein